MIVFVEILVTLEVENENNIQKVVLKIEENGNLHNKDKTVKNITDTNLKNRNAAPPNC